MTFTHFPGHSLKTLYFIDGVLQDPWGSLVNAYHSINTEDYNNFLAVFLALPVRLFGRTFFHFVLIGLNMFTVPAAFVMAAACNKLVSAFGAKPSGYWFAFSFGVFLFMPTLIFPVFSGFVDTFALLMLCLGFLLVLDQTLFITMDVKKSLFLGMALLFSMLSRRYFSIAVSGFVIALVLAAATWFLFSHKSIKNLLPFVKNMLITGLFSAAILFVFFFGFFQRSFFNNYSEAYSAYQSTDLLGNYKITFAYEGWLILLICLVGFIGAFWAKSTSARMAAVFSVTYFLGTTALFYSILTMTVHHYIVLIPAICLLVTMAAAFLVGRTRGHIKTAVCAAVVGLLLVNTGQSLVARVYYPLQARLPGAFSSVLYQPKIRYDIGQVQTLASKLAQYTDPHKIYIVASSHDMNDDTLNRAYMPHQLEVFQNLIPTIHVDVRDGIRTNFLEADIWMVPSVPQLHFPEEDQRVVTVLAEEVTPGGHFADKFEEVDSVTFPDGLICTIYQRIEEWSREDVEYWMNCFDKYYSQYPELFHDRFIQYIDENY